MTPSVVNFCLAEVRKIFPDFKLLGQFEFSAKAAEFVHDIIASEEEVAMIAPVEFKDLIGLRNTGWVGCKYRLTNGKLNFEKALSPGSLSQLLRPA
jgi:hypothetical protein